MAAIKSREQYGYPSWRMSSSPAHLPRPLFCPWIFRVERKARKTSTLTLAGDDSEQVVNHGNKPFTIGVAPQGIHQERDDKMVPWYLSF